MSAIDPSAVRWLGVDGRTKARPGQGLARSRSLCIWVGGSCICAEPVEQQAARELISHTVPPQYSVMALSYWCPGIELHSLKY